MVDMVLVVPPSPVVSFCAAACCAVVRPLCFKAVAWAAAAAASVAAFFALFMAAAGFATAARAWAAVPCPVTAARAWAAAPCPVTEDVIFLAFDIADVTRLVPDFVTSDNFDDALCRKLSILLS
jgi:hypothetical protein